LPGIGLDDAARFVAHVQRCGKVNVAVMDGEPLMIVELSQLRILRALYPRSTIHP
jgi:hypothetical protein